MNVEDGAAAFADRWVRCNTAGVDAEAAESRRAEIASDTWEQRAHGRSVDAPPIAVAVSILRRVTGGVPADLAWMHAQRAVSRGRPPEREVSAMSTVSKLVKHWWWAALAAVMGVGFLVLAVTNVTDPQGPYLDGTIVASVACMLILGGVGLRGSRPQTGDAMIVAGVTPGLIIYWFWPIPVLALVVLLCALTELAELRALDRPGRRGTVVAGVVGGAVLLVVAIGASVSAENRLVGRRRRRRRRHGGARAAGCGGAYPDPPPHGAGPRRGLIAGPPGAVRAA